MKKILKTLLCAILLVVALSVGVVAFAGNTDTVKTIATPYVGDYEATDGSGRTGFAHIVFGEVSNVDAECGILLTSNDEGWTKSYPVKSNADGEKLISDDGKFGIALYNLEDGEYTVRAYSGEEGSRILGNSYTLRAGVSAYTVTYVNGSETQNEQVAVGTTPTGNVNFVKDGYKIEGFKTANGVVYDMTEPTYDDLTLYPIWTPDQTARVTLSGNPAYLTHEASANSGETITLKFDVVEILAYSTIGNQARFGFGLVSDDTTSVGFMATNSGNTLIGSGTLVGSHVLKSDYVGETSSTLTNVPLFKSGESVKVVYKPYTSQSDKGYIKAYVKAKGASDNAYTLVGGVENITTTNGKLAFLTDNGTVLDVILANMSFTSETGGLGIENVAYAYQSGGDFTKISNTTVDDELQYDILAPSAGNVVVGSKTRLDMTYGDVYVMEFYIDYTNFGDSAMQSGNVGIGLTSHDMVGWVDSPILNPSALFLWYNGTGWGTAVRMKNASNAEYGDTSGVYTYTKPSPNNGFQYLFKTGNHVRIEYTPYFSAQETGGAEQLGSYVVYVKDGNATDYSVWASITGIPASLAPRDNIGMFIFSNKAGRQLTISNFTTRVGDHYVHSAGGNGLALTSTTMLGIDYYSHSLTLDKTSIDMAVGGEVTINATAEPVSDIIWTSSNQSVATVQDGKVTAVGDGTAIITATTPNGNSATCTVNVSSGFTVKFMLGDEEYATRNLDVSNGYKLTSLPTVDDITTDASVPYYFGGWYTDSNFTTEVSLNTTYNKDTVVYGDYRSAYNYDVVGNNAIIRGVIDELQGISELEIPSAIAGKTVTEIGYQAFVDGNLTQVTIPSSVTKIGDSAFRANYDLATVTIEGAGLTTVGNSAFRDCEKINSSTSLVLPTSVTSVGELAFYGANHPTYTGMYIKNYQSKQYYTPKYVYEFLGEDVMPIGAYGAFTANSGTGVAHPTYGVGLEQAVQDFVGAGFNLMETNTYGNYYNRWTDDETQYTKGTYMKYFEQYGAMILLKDDAMKTYLYSEHMNTGAELKEYNQYAYSKYASFGGVLTMDEPGWVEWIDEYENYTFEDESGQVTKKRGRLDDGQRAWNETFPNKLMFVNLLQTYAPKYALPNGYNGYSYGGQLDGIPNVASKPAQSGEIDYEYYYRTYIENVKPQVFSYDYYPLAFSNNKLLNTHFEQLNYANYYSGEYYKNYHNTSTGIPFWPMIQLSGFNSGIQFRYGVGANLAEVNWQINTALAYGAKGYSYFGYNKGATSTAGYAIDEYGNTTSSYNIAKTANGYAQSMAKWLLNAEVDHLTQVGSNPNCYAYNGTYTGAEATPVRMLTPQDTAMAWSLNSSSGVNHIVSHMKYYANNNDYRNNVAGDVRELYFVCNNSITNGGNITLNFGENVTGSYIYQGIERAFSGTSLTVNVTAGQAFAILLD